MSNFYIEMRKFLLFFFLLLPLFSYSEQPHHWLHIYCNGFDFHSIKIEGVSSITHSLSTSTDLSDSLIVNEKGRRLPVALSDVAMCEFGTNVPALYITIPDFPELEDLTDKETYLNAVLKVDGNGWFEDLDSAPVLIKGRGNSTWGYPKKPYRLKFDKKISICGFDKSKSYALIANYIDCTLMRNTIALKIAQLLEMPYTNHCQPIRVYFNGICKGAYIITEKIGISSSSVDLDEETGILLELDSNFDEAYKFKSAKYDLPVMVKDPDFDEVAEMKGVTPEALLDTWKNDFEEFEEKVYKDMDLSDCLDMESFVNYMLVYNICGNREILWPKSLYMYKRSIDDVYHFGPVWDFDWAFSYDNGTEDKSPELPLWAGAWDPLKGQPFFKKICSTSEFRMLYKQKLDFFKDNLLPLLMDYIDEYIELIEPSAIENGVLWPPVEGVTSGSFDFNKNIEMLKQWISDRMEYISNHRNFGLYD